MREESFFFVIQILRHCLFQYEYFCWSMKYSILPVSFPPVLVTLHLHLPESNFRLKVHQFPGKMNESSYRKVSYMTLQYYLRTLR